MFHHRSSAFAPDIDAIQNRLRALENELARVGRKAGRHASAGVSAAGDQVSDAIATAVNQIVNRFRAGGRMAGDEALRLGNEAAGFGAKVGKEALHQVVEEIEYRPLFAIGIALGIGILIGMAGARAK
jgi:hypothetical protein